jgi:hypothetical protein
LGVVGLSNNIVIPEKQDFGYQNQKIKADKFVEQLTGTSFAKEETKVDFDLNNIVELDTNILSSANFDPNQLYFSQMKIKTTIGEKIETASDKTLNSKSISNKITSLAELLQFASIDIKKESFVRLKALVGEEKALSFLQSYKDLPKSVRKNFAEKISFISSNPAILKEDKIIALNILENDSKVFVQRFKDIESLLPALENKHGKIITLLKDQIGKTEENIKHLRSKLMQKSSVELQTQLLAQEENLRGLKSNLFKTEGKKMLDYQTTLNRSDIDRFNDILEATGKSVPDLDSSTAKLIQQALPNLKDKNGNVIFKNMEEVYLAIKRRPSELSESEIDGLSKIRQAFHKNLKEEIMVSKVSLPDNKGLIGGFVIEPKYLQKVKTEKDLVDLLKLDYPDSPFVDKMGKPTFKLNDIKVKVGIVKKEELAIPLSKEFGGTRELITNQYPFSGNGFTASKGSFPVPELEIKSGVIKDTKVLGWNDFKSSRNLAEVLSKAKPLEIVDNKVVTKQAIKHVTMSDSDIDKILAKKIKDLPLNEDMKKSLISLADTDALRSNKKVFENILKELDKVIKDPKEADIFIQILKSSDPKDIALAFKEPKVGEKILSFIRDITPKIEKMGIKASMALPKIIKAISKALPAFGGIASGYDTLRMTSIAQNGRDLNGTDYTGYPKGDKRNTPENLRKLQSLRALALAGSALNNTDTALAVFEAFGVGNVAFPIQASLAVGELLIDIGIEHFRENPHLLSKENAQIFKAIGLATSIVYPTGPDAIREIYAIEGRLDIATELTKISKDLSIKGIKDLGDLTNKSLNSGIDNFIENTYVLADLIRNPEKYAKVLNKKVEDVYKDIESYLVKKSISGIDGINEVIDLIKDINLEPSKYSKFISESLNNALKEISKKGDIALKILEEAVVKGIVKINDAITYLGESGETAKKFIKNAINDVGKLGSEFISFAKDVYNNPIKYKVLASEFTSALSENISQGLINTYENSKLLYKDLSENSKIIFKNIQKDFSESLNSLVKSGKATLDTMKYIVEHKEEFSRELINETKKLFITSINTLGAGVQSTVEYLEQLCTDTKELGDALVSLISASSDTAKEVFSKHWETIKNRLPDIIDAAGDASAAIIEQLNKSVSGQKIVQVMQSLNNGFNYLLKMASESKEILSSMISSMKKDFQDAWDKSSMTNMSPLTDLVAKYYNEAMNFGSELFSVAKKALYEILKDLDQNKAGDWLPDRTYRWLND